MNILIINQYFPPDRSATSLLLGQLATTLAHENNVTVVCGSPTYDPETNSATNTKIQEIFRIRLFGGSRSNLAARLINYILFIVGAMIRVLILPRPDVVICWTDPPIVGLLGVLIKFTEQARFLFVSQDVYPEIASAVGKMNHPWILSLLQRISKIILSSADSVVAVGEDMQKQLFAKGCPAHKVHVIPNWQDLNRLQPKERITFRQNHGIPESAFIIMHSGNIGFSQDFETLLGAAENTRDEQEILYLVVGNGTRRQEIIETITKKKLSNVRLLPYQPTNLLAASLSSADVHYVSLRAALTGYVVPSKIYGILAVARPVIANVQESSEIARIVQESKCGMLCPPDPNMLAKKILHAKQNRAELVRMGQAGRAWIEDQHSQHDSLSAYVRLLEKLRMSPGG